MAGFLSRLLIHDKKNKYSSQLSYHGSSYSAYIIHSKGKYFLDFWIQKSSLSHLGSKDILQMLNTKFSYGSKTGVFLDQPFYNTERTYKGLEIFLQKDNYTYGDTTLQPQKKSQSIVIQFLLPMIRPYRYIWKMKFIRHISHLYHILSMIRDQYNILKTQGLLQFLRVKQSIIGLLYL